MKSISERFNQISGELVAIRNQKHIFGLGHALSYEDANLVEVCKNFLKGQAEELLSRVGNSEKDIKDIHLVFGMLAMSRSDHPENVYIANFFRSAEILDEIIQRVRE